MRLGGAHVVLGSVPDFLLDTVAMLLYLRWAMSNHKPQNKTPETQMVNVRVPVEQVERLRLVAEAEHRTVSQEVRRLIDLRIAESEDVT